MVRFEWAQVVAFDDEAKPAITPDDVLDARPDKLRLGLQPYLSLLELNYAVDEFLIAVKKSEVAALRGEASNTFEAMPHTSGAKRALACRSANAFISPSIGMTTCFITNGSIRRPSSFLQALREARPSKKPALPDSRTTTRTGVDWTRKSRIIFNNWSSLGWFCRFEKMNAWWKYFTAGLFRSDSALQSPLLLAVRLFWGWQFFLTGKGKLMDLAKTDAIFREPRDSLSACQAVLAGATGMFRRIASAHRFGSRG